MTKAPDGVYSVHYESDSHLAVLFQMYGSVWKKVFPYCMLNACLSYGLYYIKETYGLDLSISDKGHSLMTLFVAFLIISRVSISLGRYNEARGNLGTMYREARELIQNAFVFTKADQSLKAKQWRHELAYGISINLLLAMGVIDYSETGIPVWELPELQGNAKDFIMENLGLSKITGGDRGVMESNMRVPIQMSYYLRDIIFSVNKNVDKSSEVGPWQFGRLFGSIDSFMGGYYGMRKFITTPFPFPLVQMARTFMFIFIYTLPFALLDQADYPVVHAIVVFLVTYGFVGLETVSIELDDPFGDDENDFHNLGMAQTAVEDTYVMVYKVDGEEWMKKLRAKLNPEGSYQATEWTSLV